MKRLKHIFIMCLGIYFIVGAEPIIEDALPVLNLL